MRSKHIPKSEFARRRQELMDYMGDNSIAILPSAPVQTRNRDVDFAYRQDSDFQYLSGFPEPEAVMALIPGREHGEFVLFCRERDKLMETWHGYREGQEGAQKNYGADDAFPIGDIDDILPGLIEGKHKVFYAMGCDHEFDHQVMDWINIIRSKARAGAIPPDEFIALDHHLHDMRLYKSKAEQKVMREAAEISAQAHINAMKVCKPGMYEYQLEAEYLYQYAKSGCDYSAYPSIVGGGKNACVLHYVDNNCELKSCDLVLIDAGGELDGYAADITRTFPVNGKFSKEQKQIYELVLKSQVAAIDAVKPGNHWNDPHETVVRILVEGMVELGILKGDIEKLIEKEAYAPFYIKVEGEWRVLEPGMVLTIEPGLYIAPDQKGVSAKWKGIGVRIEDDVLVTKTGCEVLSSKVPKTVAEIEAMMSGKSQRRKPAKQKTVSKKAVSKKKSPVKKKAAKK
jgi:Xaa-Pro aminopeptidase